MSTENPLATIDETALTVPGDDVFDAIKSSSTFLPRLMLMTANSEVCKSGEFPINHYAIVSDGENKDLGAEVDVLVVAFRPLAIDEDAEGNFISCYDPKIVDGRPTGEFARIREKADLPGLNGAMYGPQFLLWVPSTQEFATFFMASKTARRASVHVKARMKEAATLGCQKIEGKEYTWYGPTCQACTTPFEMPTAEEVQQQLKTFLNPPEPQVEVAPEGDSERE